MLNIHVRVPLERDRAAVVEIRSGLSRIAAGSAVASVSLELAARHGNPSADPLRPWGHPPLGSYQLLGRGPAPAGGDLEYGKDLLVFQPMSGDALDAESFGRLLLLAYAGPTGKDGRLRPTQGGLRLQQTAFDALLAALAADSEALLSIDVLRPPAWWQFWKSAVSTAPIAAGAPKLSLPPLDEVSLATAIAAGKRLARPAATRQDRDWNDTRRDSDTSSGGSSGYSGQGGSFGGGGASGSWDAAGGGRGVDSAGRIVAGAVGAAVLAGSAEALAGSMASQDGNVGSGGDPGTNTGTSTSY